MPSGSRARTSSPVRSSNSANANMPRNRRSASGPQARQASSTTSVSELVTNRAPRAASSARSVLVVVQLAVVDQRQAVLGQRLVGGGAEVDDREPAVAELDGDPVVLVAPQPGRVRAAVRDPVGHDVDELVAVGLLVAPCDTAHVSSRLRSVAALSPMSCW